jgi:carbon-monoxide dehydrogenase small subunit
MTPVRVEMEKTVSKKVHVRATINGRETDFLCEPRQSLLDVLRGNNGNCGSCNVIMEGRLVNSCCVLAVEIQDKEITTIEGVAESDKLHPLQQKFMEHAALQCGVCTPGFILASKALLDTHPKPTEEQCRHWLAGNLCRCTGYDKIIRAVMDAAK